MHTWTIYPGNPLLQSSQEAEKAPDTLLTPFFPQ